MEALVRVEDCVCIAADNRYGSIYHVLNHVQDRMTVDRVEDQFAIV